VNNILAFNGEHRFLSNFAAVRVTLDGEVYPSVEHAYQAAKTTDAHARARVRRAATAVEAKRMGKTVTVSACWPERKLAVMEALLRQKFAQEPYKTRLLETADAHLEEGNWWGDRFWGVCRGTGSNHLGKLLMRIRDDLQA
jgi:ribA/ribD-fused uncharacterized protein